MAKTVYVDGINGDNTNDGSSWALAKKTILGARAATASGDLVLIAPGVYVEANGSFTSANDHQVLYRRAPNMPGKVYIDFENRPASGGGNGYGYHWYLDRGWFMDLHFRNPAPGAALVASGYNDPRLLHCVLYDRDGGTNVGHGVTRFNGPNPINVYNCSFYNLNNGTYWNEGNWYSNYYVSVTTPFQSWSGSRDFNAFSGNTEAHGIDTSTGANPGFTNAAGEDFTLDRTTTPADWQTFMTAGKDGGTIGAWGDGGFHYRPGIAQLAFFSPTPTAAQGNPQDGWENEGPNGTNTYTDGTPGDLILNASNEVEIDLATTPAATGGRMRSPVFDLGDTTGLLRHLSFAGWEDGGVGALIDTNTTLPQQVEYRSSTTSFAKGDPSPAWTAVTRGTDINATAQRYIQYRVTLRTDHTNA